MFPSGIGGVEPLGKIREGLGLRKLNSGLFLLCVLMWSLVFLLLIFGLILVIWQIIWGANPLYQNEIWDWRFLIAKLAALTATLGAVVALPFTLVRLAISRQQTRHAEEVLFHDKITSATRDLHARRQATKQADTADVSDTWEDDIVRRSIAAGTLGRLLEQSPENRDDIISMLCLYVQELSKWTQNSELPSNINSSSLKDWKAQLRSARRDLEKALQVVGQAFQLNEIILSTPRIDLRHANLQAMDLNKTNFSNSFLQHANMRGAEMRKVNLQSTNLNSAKMDAAFLREANLKEAHLHNTSLVNAFLRKAYLGEADLDGVDMRFSDLKYCRMDRARLRFVDLSNALNLRQTQLNSCYGVRSGYGTVILPSHLKPPAHWHEAGQASEGHQNLRDRFDRAYRAWVQRRSAQS